MQIFTSIDANVYIYKCKFTYANICIFIRRAEGRGGGAWQAGRQGGTLGYCASRGRQRAARRLCASRGTATLREASSDGGPARCRAEGPPLRSLRPCGAKRSRRACGVGAAAEALQRGGPPALAASLSAAPAGTLPPCCPAPAGLAEGRSCPACLPACLRGRGLGTRRRPGLPPSAFRFRVSGGLFLPFLLHGAQRV